MKLTSRYLALFLFLLSHIWLGVVLDERSQEYPVDAGGPQVYILSSKLFLLHIMKFLRMLSVVLLSILMIILSTVNVIGHLIFGKN